jgi:hypothetical protein
MALTLNALRLLEDLLPGKRVLSLGYLDLAVRAEDLRSLFWVIPTRFTQFGRWHGVTYPLPETLELFEAIGATLTCVDIRASRGVERVVDLNYRCDLGTVEVVLDPGTIEHRFNIGQAILNAAGAVAPGGVICHSPPLSMMNHGFYNLNPTLLHDFYTQIGWSIQTLIGATKEGGYQVPPTQRFSAPPEAHLFCIATRKEAGPLVFPKQSKYLFNPDLARRCRADVS